jgi:hypothetical protein
MPMPLSATANSNQLRPSTCHSQKFDPARIRAVRENQSIRRLGPPSQSWRTFLRNYADAIAAIDLCVVPTLSFERLFAFLVLGHGHELFRLGADAPGVGAAPAIGPAGTP